MYQIKWNEIVPQLLPKIIDRRLVRAHGSFFDCQFTLNFDDNSCIQFKCDDLIHRNAIEFEIILNRQKIYNPLHFDSTDVFTSNLGIITEAKEYRTTKRNNVREILIFFDAKKKFFKLSQLIYQSTIFNKHKLNETVSEEICSFLQPRNDKLTIRTYRKVWHDLKKYEDAKDIKRVEKHQKLIKQLYPNQEDNNTNNGNEQEIDYNDSVFNLYPIQSNQLTLQSVRNPQNGTTSSSNQSHQTEDATTTSPNDIAKSLYPIKNEENEDEDETMNDQDQTEKIEDVEMSESNVSSANNSNVNLKKKDYDKVYCDVVCRISAWNTFTSTAKKKKY